MAYFRVPLSTGFAETPAQFAALQAQVVALQKQVTVLLANKALALAPYVTVDIKPQMGVRGPNITFSGANIHIVSGSGSTIDSTSGRGNLIIGYNEIDKTLTATDRLGAHNLILGRFNGYTAGACIISGDSNYASSYSSAIIAGQGDYVQRGYYDVVIGGLNNESSGDHAVTVGGDSIFADRGAILLHWIA